MEKRYYTAETLEAELRRYEQRFGLDSAAFFAAHTRGEAPEEIDPFDRTVWAQFYRQACRLRGRNAATAQLQPAG
jgi:hypothetical protein